MHGIYVQKTTNTHKINLDTDLKPYAKNELKMDHRPKGKI